MADYTNEYSKLPDELYVRHNFKDVDDFVGALITQIRTLQAENHYAEAQAIIEANKTNLEPYVLSTKYLNAIDEETRNLEMMAQERSQMIFVQDNEPKSFDEGDVWIGGGELATG